MKIRLHDRQPSQQTRSWKLFIPGILSLAVIIYLVFSTEPTASISVFSLQLPLIALFFVFSFFSLFSIFSFVFTSKIHGVLIALIAVVYLLFRQNDLTHPFFAILLLALFLVLELMFTYKK